MLEGLYMNHHPLAGPPSIQAVRAASASQPQQQLPPALPLLLQQQQQQPHLAGAPVPRLHQPQPQLQSLPAAVAPSSSISAGSSSLQALLVVGCSKREAEVAWDLLTMWRLMRLGFDPGYGQYHLPLQRYTCQPALLLRLQACKSEKQLAKYVVRLVHAFRKKCRQGGGDSGNGSPTAAAGPGHRPAVEQGVQLMNQLLRLMAAGEGGNPVGAPLLRQHQQLQLHMQQQQHQQQQQQQQVVPMLYQQPQQQQDLWGHEVVMGMPRAVLLDAPQHAQHADMALGVAAEMREAESAVMGLPQAPSGGDFLN